ncbi:DUF4233 domain-containing protein [Myceligenerans indicum]|uniref:DUF4233 domain-containing protein n=1 Tax=Myceligenerans indicum TaxID=2593663 RepID=A0ABS1LLD3_9MICO|nr:DUF4233 domain-containing protein [Myceligenerans indicum]MBL0887065.1 DUF4233 domain-containing protein [Myceligenerans indicum]
MSKDRPAAGDRIKAKPSALVQFTSTVLACEAVVVLFVTLVAFGLRDLAYERGPLQSDSAAVVWGVGGGIALLLLLLSRLTRRPAGLVAGTMAQVLVLATGLAVPLATIVNLVFVALWVMALRLGSRVDRERAAYDATHPETAPNS